LLPMRNPERIRGDSMNKQQIILFEFVRLKNALSDLIGIPVDLATPDALHPALKDDILREAVHVA